MKYSITFFCILFLGTYSICGQNKANTTTNGIVVIHSTVLNEDRTCFISVPDSYHHTSEEKKEYPIIILLDGYAFFKTATGIVHFMSAGSNRNYFMPETIIIAIENVDRERDFTVTKIKTKRPNTMGGGKLFLKFIENELIPYVDKHYRTLPHRTLIGHSLGGLLTVNAFMDENSIFNAYVAIDPSIWWDDQMITEKVQAVKPISFTKKLYIATANQGEARDEKNRKRHHTLYALLKKKGAPLLQVKNDYFEKENHRSVPLIAIYKGLRYLNNEN